MARFRIGERVRVTTRTSHRMGERGTVATLQRSADGTRYGVVFPGYDGVLTYGEWELSANTPPDLSDTETVERWLDEE